MNLAEMTGTFGLVFVGAGSITIGLPHVWISIAFGLIVTLMILCFGKISGAHINPAVSLGFYILTKQKSILHYIPFQLLGGLLAGVALWFLFPENATYGETKASDTVLEAGLIEVLITAILMYSIHWLVGKELKLPMIALLVGLVVGLAAYFAGPYTGASMNPARSLGPAIVADFWDGFWMYMLAPVIGSAIATFIYKYFSRKRNRLIYSS